MPEAMSNDYLRTRRFIRQCVAVPIDAGVPVTVFAENENGLNTGVAAVIVGEVIASVFCGLT